MPEITPTNPLGMKTMAEMKEKGFLTVYGETLKGAYVNDWVFTGWERLIVLASVVWSVWNIGHWIWGLF